MTPVVLVVAGLDPSGGAGLFADREALLAVGARGLFVATAITAQGRRGVLAVEPVPARMLAAQLDALAGEKIAAVKVGMLGSAENAAALARGLRRIRAPLVLDTPLVSTSGHPLFVPGPAGFLAAYRPLFARATVATPNRPELGLFAGRAVRGDDDAVRAARALGCPAVLVKGGHRAGAPVDLLVTARGVEAFQGTRLPEGRGTGCRLASAIAGLLAGGIPLGAAVDGARAVVRDYLTRSGRPGPARSSGRPSSPRSRRG